MVLFHYVLAANFVLFALGVAFVTGEYSFVLFGVLCAALIVVSWNYIEKQNKEVRP